MHGSLRRGFCVNTGPLLDPGGIFITCTSPKFMSQHVCETALWLSRLILASQADHHTCKKTKNKPAAQAAGADPSQCNFTKICPFSKMTVSFEPLMQF